MTEQSSATQGGAWVIGVASVKGGICKSTTSIHLGGGFHRLKRNVLIVDTDNSTRTARNWQQEAADQAAAQGEEYTGPKVVGVDSPKTLRDAIPKLRGKFDVIIIDGAAMGDAMLGAIIEVCDLLISPATANSNTLRHALNTMDLARSYHQTHGRPVHGILFSNIKPNTRLYKDRRAEAEEVAPVFDGFIANSTRVDEAMDCGGTVWDFPKDSAAVIKQFNELTLQCVAALNGKHAICSWQPEEAASDADAALMAELED
ncbi:AAA family ATPase (plasmid) [Microbulbifer sp. ANSA003]|uniref:nucleotide-binding protein n=1 Tax=unclassified Microbulbifer TaxID=2619833 RepID=UPI00403A5061